MDIKLEDLKAFLVIQQSGTFSKASNALGLSQSALSQKIAKLEEGLHAAIFVRHPRSLSLTASGEKLLSYAKETVERQEEFLKSFNQYNEEMAGVIRIAGFSSVMRSIVIPRLGKFLKEHEGVNVEFSVHEMFELEGILKSNRADFIVTDYSPQIAQFDCHEIGKEEYVIIESNKKDAPQGIYLDHGPQDNATSSYLQFIGSKEKYSRRYMGDVYSIIDGVSLGLGKAVMSRHLIENDKRFKVKTHKKKYQRPIVLSQLTRTYYGPLQSKILDLLCN